MRSALTLGRTGSSCGLHLDSLVLRLASHGLHRLVDSLVEIRLPQFEFGLAQELADARNDVAGAPIVALDVAQDVRHLAQLGRIGAEQYFGRAGIVVDGPERLIELVRDRCGHLAQCHPPVHVRHLRKALPRLRLGHAAPAALGEQRRDQQALPDDDCQRREDLPPMFTPVVVVGKPDFAAIRQASLVQRPALQRAGIGNAPARHLDQTPSVRVMCRQGPP